MKLIIQIPCFNEEDSLEHTLSQLPRELPGLDRIEWLVIDDGSTDRTSEIAQAYGVDHIVRLHANQGLARAFMAGLNYAISKDADIILNTDADNQYEAADIPKLIQPLISGQADMAIGTRPIETIESFSPMKKSLQHIGSWVIRWFSGTDVKDAPSGFRAITRQAAIQLNVFTDYTYTLETIIQAGHKNISVINIPVRVNPTPRKSRLVRNIFSYVWRSTLTIFRVFIIYRPMRFFAFVALLFFVPGVFLCLRFLFDYFHGAGDGKVQSLILAALLIGTSALLTIAGILADLIAVNRKILERLQSTLLTK